LTHFGINTARLKLGIRLAPKALFHCQPGASPQECESACKQALKARFN